MTRLRRIGSSPSNVSSRNRKSARQERARTMAAWRRMPLEKVLRFAFSSRWKTCKSSA